VRSAIRQRRFRIWALGPLAVLLATVGCVDAAAVIHGPVILQIVQSAKTLPARGGVDVIHVTLRGASTCELRAYAPALLQVDASGAIAYPSCSSGTWSVHVYFKQNRTPFTDPVVTTVIATSAMGSATETFTTVVKRSPSVSFEAPGTSLPITPSAGPIGQDSSFATSPSSAGFFVSSPSDTTDARGSWTVPDLDCGATSNAETSTWVGIGGINGSPGPLDTGVLEKCDGGVSRDQGFWVDNPGSDGFVSVAKYFTKFSIRPGDVMKAAVVWLGSTWATELSDSRTGLSGFSLLGSAWGIADGRAGGTIETVEGSGYKNSFPGADTAEWLQEAPGTGLPDFGSVSFDGMTTNIPDWTLLPTNAVEMVAGQSVLAMPSNPTTNAFQVTWQ
jgi:Peptidase A4 family